MISKLTETQALDFAACHGGTGTLKCFSMLEAASSQRFSLFHRDILPPGVSIGVHEHTHNEEIYFLISGICLMTVDDQTAIMEAGDLSLCGLGHRHGIKNIGSEDAVLIVIASR